MYVYTRYLLKKYLVLVNYFDKKWKKWDILRFHRPLDTVFFFRADNDNTAPTWYCDSNFSNNN